MNETFDLRRTLPSINHQKGRSKRPHNPTFSFFFLDLNFFLTDFGHNGPELPWAAEGRMEGLYPKKINKQLTGTPFLETFRSYTPIFLSRFHGSPYRIEVKQKERESHDE